MMFTFVDDTWVNIMIDSHKQFTHTCKLKAKCDTCDFNAYFYQLVYNFIDV